MDNHHRHHELRDHNGDDNENDIEFNAWLSIPINNSTSSEARLHSNPNDEEAFIGWRNTEDITKYHFNRDVNVDIHCIMEENDQAQRYEIAH